VHNLTALSLDVDRVDQQASRPQSRSDGKDLEKRTIALMEKVYLKVVA